MIHPYIQPTEWDRFSIKLFSEQCFISRKCNMYPVGWMFFSLPKSSRYPWRPCPWNPKKKNAGDTARKGAPHGSCGGLYIMIRSWSSWSDHDLIMIWITKYSWKKDISWSTWWSRDHEDSSSWLQTPEKFNHEVVVLPRLGGSREGWKTLLVQERWFQTGGW